MFTKILKIHLPLLVFVLSGCLPVKPSGDILVGLWNETSFSCSFRKAQGCSSIRFFPDNTFEATNIPVQMLNAFIAPNREINISGNWEISEDPSDPSGLLDAHVINLFILPNPNLPNGDIERIRITFEGKGLYFGGDETPDLYFHKSP